VSLSTVTILCLRQNAIMLNVSVLNVKMLIVILLSVIMMSVIMLSVIMLSVIMVSVIMLSVIMLSVIMLSVFLLIVGMLVTNKQCHYAEFRLNVITLNAVLLTVMAPFKGFMPRAIESTQFATLGPYSQHFIFFVTYKSPNKLDRYITLSCKGLPMTNTLTYWACL
jgi:hypothetical protein